MRTNASRAAIACSLLPAAPAAARNLLSNSDFDLERTYFNPLGRPFEPVQDTSAFATCP